jgi:hypothetical protein
MSSQTSKKPTVSDNAAGDLEPKPAKLASVEHGEREPVKSSGRNGSRGNKSARQRNLAKFSNRAVGSRRDVFLEGRRKLCLRLLSGVRVGIAGGWRWWCLLVDTFSTACVSMRNIERGGRRNGRLIDVRFV